MFEDVRIKPEQWPAMKRDPKFEYGQMPVLDYNGKLISQSMAIMYFLGAENKLIPSNPMEEYEMINIMCAINDLITELGGILFTSKTPEEKKTKTEEFIAKSMMFTFQKIEKKLDKPNRRFLVGSSISLADFAMAGFSNSLLEKPNLKKVIENKVPVLYKYLEEMLKSLS